ncbi:MAG: M23 family metallopeptidase [Bacteroidetes bacterium]|nr:M23 family metallopeptidase [Bacteroidota bacterium]MBL7104996.1 M23 family metallopeptidase [Bacteroidales bacterium]
MSSESKKEKRKHWINKLRNKYRLVIKDEGTFEEKISFRLSRLNVFVAIGTVAIILIVATTFLIAFTPLREYIPGYTDVALQKRVNDLLRLTDSLETEFKQNSLYIKNIKNIIEGKEIIEDTAKQTVQNINYDNIEYTRSVEDSILRAEYENGTSYNLYYNDNEELSAPTSTLSSSVFFTPLKGIITTEFDLSARHYGIDIVARQNEAVKATLDGTVIFSDWTVETGYVISIQHKNNFISVYKHNSVLLKQEGNIVKAGEPIAIVGESGELTTGPHLHFELWYNGTPVNPKDYIAF